MLVPEQVLDVHRIGDQHHPLGADPDPGEVAESRSRIGKELQRLAGEARDASTVAGPW